MMIRGEIVNLRAIEASDKERCHGWINDREVTQFLTMRFPVSMLQEQRWVETDRDPTKQLELAIETLEKVHIGNCSLTEVCGPDRSAELGIVIGDKEYWGKGYGTDAIVTLCGFGFTEMNLHRIRLHVIAHNARAIRCYEKCGFEHEGRLREALFRRGSYHDVLVMGILEEEYRAKWPERWGA